ncbi:nuclear transport factor 2 family protein [Streptomyces inhibens]|uniref:nuclear transport factor 2 family protein n=1 Tax=Streptomyces inhibens TaxID=2293571 RepID=UPI001EE6E6F8|nr:nuclear transport factor 2 family protein [Streptomyces inhibens]UKY47783.1 nuclear transport factor 2 family protein [Streptomyces inhibens]
MTRTTRETATGWFSALTSGDADRALGYLADDIEWVNYTPVPGYNDRMPWIGTYHGPAAVLDSLKVFLDVVDVGTEELVELIVEGDQAIGILYEKSVVKKTGQAFEIEFIQRLTVRDGKIVRWKSYTDPSQILRAIDGRAA